MKRIIIPLPIMSELAVAVSYNESYLIGTEYISVHSTDDKSTIKTTDLFAERIKNEFKQYFNGENQQFSLPFDIQSGTRFEQKVWNALIKIPYGQLLSYGQIASELATSPRAVGNACRSNPLPIVIPCHRVVAKQGIGGYAGDTELSQKTQIDFLAIKKWFLTHEQQTLRKK